MSQNFWCRAFLNLTENDALWKRRKWRITARFSKRSKSYPPRLKDALISEKVRFPNSLQCEYEELCVFRGVRYTATKTAIDKSDFLLRYRRNRVRFSHQSSEKQGGWIPTGRQVCCRPGSKGKNWGGRSKINGRYTQVKRPFRKYDRETPSMTGFQRFLTPNYRVNEYIEYTGGVFTWKNQQLWNA